MAQLKVDAAHPAAVVDAASSDAAASGGDPDAPGAVPYDLIISEKYQELFRTGQVLASAAILTSSPAAAAASCDADYLLCISCCC